MFRDVPGCSGMFRNVPRCSMFLVLSTAFCRDTLTIMPNKASADNFLDILNQCHSSIKFTMKMESNGMLPFLGTQLLNKNTHVETKVYDKLTNTGLLLHFKNHVDDRSKRGLLKTMVDRTFRLSSNWRYFSEECD